MKLIIFALILCSCAIEIKYKIGTRVFIDPVNQTEEHVFNRCSNYGNVADFDRGTDGVTYTVRFQCLDADNRRVFKELEYQQVVLNEVKEKR